MLSFDFNNNNLDNEYKYKEFLLTVNKIFGSKMFTYQHTKFRDYVRIVMHSQKEFADWYLLYMARNVGLWASFQDMIMTYPSVFFLVPDYCFCLMNSVLLIDIYKIDPSDVKSRTCITSYIIPEYVRQDVKTFVLNSIKTMPHVNIGTQDLQNWYTLPANSLIINTILKTLKILVTENNGVYVVKTGVQTGLIGFRYAQNHNLDIHKTIKKDDTLDNILDFTFFLPSCSSVLTQLKGNCAKAISELYPCAFCKPGIEYFKMMSCHACSDVTCADDEDIVECCGNIDTHCAKKQLDYKTHMCMNKIHDYGEECDLSDINSPFKDCCETNCTLTKGFYTTPPCQTVCGDGIQAGDEECDDTNSFDCDRFTCKKTIRDEL